jgi:hypothetical protein
MYSRYVDDVFAIFGCEEHVNKFLEVLNGQHRNLEFTVERAAGSLPFLDVDVKLKKDNTIETCIYRKQTNTDVLLNFDSVAPGAWKRGLIKCLLHRAKTICSSEALMYREFGKISNIFYRNGYPDWFVKREKDKFVREMNEEKTNLREGEEGLNEWKNILTLPYVGKDTVRFGKRLKRSFVRMFSRDVKIAYRNCKVGEYFSLKDPTPPLFASNVVYKFQCSVDGDTSYVGVTTRQLCARIVEHLNPKQQSAVQSHLAQCKRCCNETALSKLFTVLKRCRSEREAQAMEVMLIAKLNPSLNIQLGKERGQSFLLKVFK